MRHLLIIIVLVKFTYCSFINVYPRYQAVRIDGDPGEPLFLTPLIEKNHLELARQKAEVKGGDLEWVKSYSGYLTVNKHYNSNMFFWYFPAETNEISSNDVNNAPVILWLQGGPGASSLFGLFTENGPFSVNTEEKLEKRQYSWHKNHHLIYIDNPVGTGFSFTDDDQGYARDEIQVGRDLHEAIIQIFTLFPDLQMAPFYVTGESYGGKYVPALAYRIHKQKEKLQKRGITARADIKLTGIAIGNGLTDPLHQLNYADYLYQIGLVDRNGQAEFRKYQKEGINCIKKRDMDCAFNKFDALINMDKTKYGSLFKNLTGLDSYFNYINPKKDMGDNAMGKFLQSASTRKSIHVGNKTFHDLEGENKVEDFLKKDIMDSVAIWMAELLGYYKVCIYNGQLDIIVAYPLTVNYLHRLKFPNADDYRNAARSVWRVDDDVAGYFKKGGNLFEVLVRNAGHMSPADQPKWVFNLITDFTHQQGMFKEE